jgi:hypothetical protein
MLEPNSKNNNQVILDILHKFWSEECEIVGLSNVEDIVNGDVEFEQAEGGHYIDFGEILILLATAAAFAKDSIELVEMAKRRLGREPTHIELIQEASSRKLEPEGIEPTKREAIYEYLCVYEETVEDVDK